MFLRRLYKQNHHKSRQYLVVSSFVISVYKQITEKKKTKKMAKQNPKQDLRLLFQRPFEPLFTKKDNGKVAFDVPEDYYTDRYKPIGTSLSSRIGEDVDRTVHLRPVSHPDLEFAAPIKMRGPFSLFNKKHQVIAGQLIKIFLDLPDADTLLSTAAYIKDRVNPYLFQVSATNNKQ